LGGGGTLVSSWHLANLTVGTVRGSAGNFCFVYVKRS